LSGLAVEVHGDLITVTRPGTDLMVRYRTVTDGPNLKMVYTSWVPMTLLRPDVSIFRAEAFQLALAKADELHKRRYVRF
jgi:hypothetical protein